MSPKQSMRCRGFLSYCDIIAVLTLTLSLTISVCGLASAQIHEDESLEQVTELMGNITLTNSTDGNLENSSVNETSWDDGNWRRKDRSRIAAVAVYFSVILIAIFGVLIRYFLTQYETLQAKAQLEYQQLRNVRIQ